MARKTIRFNSWGSKLEALNLHDAIAFTSGTETRPSYTVARSLARRAKLDMISCRFDADCCDSSGKRKLYEVTLGRSVRGGGAAVEARVWFSIPVK